MPLEQRPKECGGEGGGGQSQRQTDAVMLWISPSPCVLNARGYTGSASLSHGHCLRLCVASSRADSADHTVAAHSLKHAGVAAAYAGGSRGGGIPPHGAVHVLNVNPHKSCCAWHAPPPPSRLPTFPHRDTPAALAATRCYSSQRTIVSPHRGMRGMLPCAVGAHRAHRAPPRLGSTAAPLRLSVYRQ